MINERFLGLGSSRSVIRELFEYGKKRKQEIGEDKVFDFSLGNPSIDSPKSVNDEILRLVQNEKSTLLHGYTSAQGDRGTLQSIADSINRRFNVGISADLIYMTCGAAASLTISLCALVCKGDSVVALAPYFPEYKVFTETAGAVFKVAKPLNDMTIDFAELEKTIDNTVKAVIVNSPNNPSGVVYSKEQIVELGKLLERKSKEYGHIIYLIADEPYRELSYDVEVPYLMNYYDDTIVCYSYSKSLSLPGERIGYIAVCPKMQNAKEVYLAVCGAGRGLGYVCAPSLFQFVAKANVDTPALVERYKENRDLLCEGLKKFGFEFATPDGAFYLFVKAPDGDAEKFCEKAKKFELLIVSGKGFGVDTHARIAYCVSKEQIINSLPAFELLMKEYR